MVIAVLPEERFALIDHQRHAIVAAQPLIRRVGFDHRVETFGLGGLHRVQLGQIATGSGKGIGEVIALVPAIDLARPDQVADCAQYRQSLIPFRCQCSQPGQAVNVRLLFWIGPGGKIHRHRIEARPAQGHPGELCTADGVFEQITGPQRIGVGEEIGLAHRNRQHWADIDMRIPVPLQLHQPRRDQIGIGAAERPVEVDSVGHCAPISITKRYFTSAFSIRSNAWLIWSIRISSISDRMPFSPQRSSIS